MPNLPPMHLELFLLPLMIACKFYSRGLGINYWGIRRKTPYKFEITSNKHESRTPFLKSGLVAKKVHTLI